MTFSPFPSPQDVKQKIYLSSTASHFIAQARSQCLDILEGRDVRKIFIIGPCSIHDSSSIVEYATRFKQLAREVEASSLLMLRVYVEKARTSTGWKGFLYDPHLDGSCAMETGITRARELLSLLAEMGVACATEFVDPLAALYLEDLIAWGCIGARTASSQIHRQLASSLSLPVGFKNSVEGNIEQAIYGMQAAAEGHTFLSATQEGRLCLRRSSGNPHTHLVLRGSCKETNYDATAVASALNALKHHGLRPRLMIDCSHGNAQKQADQQLAVFASALEQIRSGNEALLGMMLESHLEKGNQLHPSVGPLKYATSITDPCLDWPATEALILEAHEALSASYR